MYFSHCNDICLLIICLSNFLPKPCKGQCLLPVDGLCQFCSFSYYDSTLLDHFFTSIPFPQNNCLPIQNSYNERIILVTNQDIPNNSAFNATYGNLSEALFNETIFSRSFSNSKVTFYLTKGEHFIYKSSPVFMFRRQNISVTIKPLFCAEFNWSNVCCDLENPKISLKSLNIVFFIANRMEIQNIDLDAIDINYFNSLNESCLYSNDSCCDQNSLLNSYNACYLNYSYPQNQSSENHFFGFFHLEAIYDNPNYSIPELRLINMRISNFYIRGSQNPSFLSFIAIDYFGGSLFIQNLTLNSSFFEASFILYNSSYNLIRKDFKFEGFSNYLTNFYSKIELQYIHIVNLTISNIHLFGLEKKISTISWNNALINIQNFNANFSIKESSITNTNLKLNSPLFVFNNCSQLLFYNLSIQNLQNSSFMSCQACTISFYSISMYNITWSVASFYYFSKSIVSFNNLTLKNSTSALSGNQFLLVSSSNLNINSNEFSSVNFLSMKFSVCTVIIAFSRFTKLTMNTNSQFYFDNSNVTLVQSNFNQISGFNNFLYFLSCNQLQIISTAFNLFDGGYFISGTSVSTVLISNSSFTNMSNIVYLLNKATTFKNVFISNSQFTNMTLKSALIYSVTTLNFSVSLSNFENISFISSKATSLIAVQIGQELIQDSFFSNILFLLGGSIVINFKVSNVVVKNSHFLNCGFAYQINIANFASIEYVNLFMIWTCKEVTISNNSFINKGAINLFSGFLYITLTQVKVTIEYNYFSIQNKVSNTYYTGVISENAPIVILNSNKFHSIQCPNYSSFLHNNGAVSLQGDSSYALTANQKVANISNNMFFDCKCQNGGSLGIINYDYFTIDKLYIHNSSATWGGGLIIAGATLAIIQRVNINGTSATQAHLINLMSVIKFYMNNVSFINGFSNSSGGLKIRNVLNVYVNLLLAIQIQTIDNGAVFNIYSGKTYMSNSSFILCKAVLAGPIIFLKEKGEMTLFGIVGMEIISKYGGIYLDSAVFFSMNNSNFSNAFSTMQGCVLFINEIEIMVLKYISIDNSESLTTGIIFLKDIEKEAYYYISDIFSNNNIADEGSCVYSEALGVLIIERFFVKENQNTIFFFASQFPRIIEINNGTITGSKTNADIIYSNNANFVLNSVFFDNNTIWRSILYFELMPQTILLNISFFANKNNNSIITPLIFCQQSFLNASILKFSQTLEENFWMYFFSGKQSSIFLENLTINEQKHSNVAFIDIEGGYLSLILISFIRTTGLILQIVDGNVTIEDCQFLKNNEEGSSEISDIEISAHFASILTVTIKNSNFSPYYGISNHLSNIQFIFYENCTFIGNLQTQGIEIAESQFLSIVSCEFSNMMKLLGGGSGLSITSQNIQKIANVSISDSSFSSNVGCFAGAFFLKGLYNLTLKNSKFLNNSAKNPNVLKCGIGGVAFLQCNLPFACQFNLFDNFFGNNYADYMAPTVFSKSNITEGNNSFLNNSDRINFTSKFSSFPLKIQLTNDSINETVISSGSFFVLVFYLKDYFHQDFFTMKSSTAVVLDLIENSPDLIMKNTISLSTVIGVYNFSNLMITKKPLTSFILELRIVIFDEITSTADYFSKKFNFYSRACKIGELITSDFECKMCETTHFSLIDPMQFPNIHKCSKCMTNSYCPGGSYLIPLSGYWRFSANTTKIMMCILKDACTGPPNISSTDLFENYDFYSQSPNLIHGECHEGHEGNLCHKCIEGYGKTSVNSLCAACDSINLISYLKMAGTLVFVLFYSYFSAKAFMEVKKNDSNDILGMVSKIVVNHLQKMSIITAFNFVDFGISLQNFMAIINLLSFLNENNISNECLLRKFVTDSENFYIYKVFISFVVPIVESLICLLILIILRVWMFLHIWKSNFTLRKIYLIFLICCFLCYPLVTKCSLSMINCISLDDTSHKYLFSSPNILCWEGIHLKVFMAIGFLGIFVWGLCFPIILAYIIRCSISNKINPDVVATQISTVWKVSEKKKTRKSTSELENSELYLFFYQDYKKKFYFWESVIFLQKFFLSLLPNMVTFLGDTIDTLFVVVMVLYLFLLVKINPYKLAPLNFLEFFSILTTILSRLVMVVISTYANNSEMVSSGTVLLILINSSFFLFALFIIYKFNNWKKMISKYNDKISFIKNKVRTTTDFFKNSVRSFGFKNNGLPIVKDVNTMLSMFNPHGNQKKKNPVPILSQKKYLSILECRGITKKDSNL